MVKSLGKMQKANWHTVCSIVWYGKVALDSRSTGKHGSASRVYGKRHFGRRGRAYRSTHSQVGRCIVAKTLKIETVAPVAPVAPVAALLPLYNGPVVNRSSHPQGQYSFVRAGLPGMVNVPAAWFGLDRLLAGMPGKAPTADAVGTLAFSNVPSDGAVALTCTGTLAGGKPLVGSASNHGRVGYAIAGRTGRIVVEITSFGAAGDYPQVLYMTGAALAPAAPRATRGTTAGVVATAAAVAAVAAGLPVVAEPAVIAATVAEPVNVALAGQAKVVKGTGKRKA